MFLELREIDIGENWFNKNSERLVIVSDIYIEKGTVQVNYNYLDKEDKIPYCTCKLEYFMKEYERLPYKIECGK